MQYLGNFAPDATIDFKFTTVNSSGVPTALSSGAVLVYKDNSTTESTSTGITLTASQDSRTGMNHVRIDFSSQSSFFTAGSNYQVVLTGGTVDGNSVVGYVVAHFNIEAEVSNVTHWRGSQVNVLQSGRVDSYVGALASAVITATAIASNAITDAKIASGALTAAKFAAGAFDAVWSVATRLLTAGTNIVLAKGTGITGFNDLSAAQVNAEVDTALSDYGALKPTIAGRTLDVTATGEAGIDWSNIGAPTTTVTLSGTTIKTATDVETDTADLQTRIPAALVGGRIVADMTAISGDETAADNAESFFDGTGYAGTNNVIPTVTNLTNAPSDSTGVGTLLTRIGTPSDLGSGASISDNLADIEAQTDDIGTAGAGLTSIPWNTSWDTEVESEVADALAAYGAATATDVTNAVTDVPTAADIRAEIDSNSTQLAAIVADTDELQSDWADGGRLDVILDARASQTSVDDVPTVSEFNARTLASADYATAAAVQIVDDELEAVDTVVDAIKLKTDNLPTDPADQSLVIAAIDALNDLDATAVQTAAAAALTAYDPPTNAEMEARTLVAADYFVVTDYTAPNNAGIQAIEDALDDLLEDDGGVLRFTANALEEAPTGGSAPTVSEIRIEMDNNSTKLADILADTAVIGTAGAGLTNIPYNPSWGEQIESEVADALAVYDVATVTDVTTATSGLSTFDPLTDEVNANVTNWRGNQPGNVDGNGFVPANLASINGSTTRATNLADDLDADVLGAVKVVTDKVDTALVSDGAVYQFTSNALELAPTGGGSGATAEEVWEYGTRTLTDAFPDVPTVVEIRNELDANSTKLDVAVSSRSTLTAAQVWSYVDRQVTEVSSAIRNQIADNILRRSLASALSSADGDTKGFRSLAGAIAKLVNRVTVSGSTLTVYETNDSTTLGTQTVTSDEDAEPITGVDTNA